MGNDTSKKERFKDNIDKANIEDDMHNNHNAFGNVMTLSGTNLPRHFNSWKPYCKGKMVVVENDPETIEEIKKVLYRPKYKGLVDLWEMNLKNITAKTFGLFEILDLDAMATFDTNRNIFYNALYGQSSGKKIEKHIKLFIACVAFSRKKRNGDKAEKTTTHVNPDMIKDINLLLSLLETEITGFDYVRNGWKHRIQKIRVEKDRKIIQKRNPEHYPNFKDNKMGRRVRNMTMYSYKEGIEKSMPMLTFSIEYI
ncbi:MAG: hypothetical protein V3V00_13455 [Saprospiraceae bacterium]